MTRIVTIEGMMCVHCQTRVDKVLNEIPGVTATVNLEQKSATVTGDVADEVLRKAITGAGYTVTDIR